MALYKAVTTRKGHAASVKRQSRQRLRSDRRYTPYFGVCRFHGRLYGSEVRSRERHAAPLQWCTPFNDSRYELEVPSRDCHVALLLAMTHQVVRRCTSALLPLNGSVQGGHYPQGARRIRKAAKPLTAAQGTPLHPILWRLPFSRQTVRVGSAQPGAACRSPTVVHTI